MVGSGRDGDRCYCGAYISVAFRLACSEEVGDRTYIEVKASADGFKTHLDEIGCPLSDAVK